MSSVLESRWFAVAVVALCLVTPGLAVARGDWELPALGVALGTVWCLVDRIRDRRLHQRTRTISRRRERETSRSAGAEKGGLPR